MIIEISHERAVELTEKIARFIVERKMAAPALVAIESMRPLHRIGSQLLYFIAPFAEIIFNPKEYQEVAAMLEKDEYVNMLLNRIDELDMEIHAEERKQKKLVRKRKMKKLKQTIAKIFKR